MMGAIKVIAAFSLVLGMSVTASETDSWYGESPDNEAAAVPVDIVMGSPDEWLDRALTVSGRITDVCTNRGCWAVFEAGGEILRIQARDHSFAMPAEYRGEGIAHGVLERVEVSAEHAHHMVDDDGADPALLETGHEYRLIADGVRLTE